jgi:hypothetical protein
MAIGGLQNERGEQNAMVLDGYDNRRGMPACNDRQIYSYGIQRAWGLDGDSCMVRRPLDYRSNGVFDHVAYPPFCSRTIKRSQLMSIIPFTKPEEPNPRLQLTLVIPKKYLHYKGNKDFEKGFDAALEDPWELPECGDVSDVEAYRCGHKAGKYALDNLSLLD